MDPYDMAGQYPTNPYDQYVTQAQNDVQMNPHMAAAYARIANMYDASRGALGSGGMVANPIEAYQNAVFQNAKLRQAQETMRRSDPYYDFEEGKRRGILPPEMTWAEFQQSQYKLGGSGLTAPQKNLETYLKLNPKGEDESDAEFNKRVSDAFNRLVRPTRGFSVGGGQYDWDPMTGQLRTSFDPAVGEDLEASLASRKEEAQKWAAA